MAASSLLARRPPACSWPDEIQRSGRPVTLSVGEHVRLPRIYRGRDMLWWMDAAGIWNQRYDEIDDLTRARRLPSPQLVGTPERTTLDLNALSARRRRARRPSRRDPRRPGALLRRPAQPFRAGRPQDGSPAGHLRRVGADARPSTPTSARPERFEPTACRRRHGLSLDLSSGEIRSIVWATGFHPDYRWLDVPVLDRKGQLRHEGGAWSTRRACTRLACPCSAAASRPSSMARKTTRGTSSRIWCLDLARAG